MKRMILTLDYHPAGDEEMAEDIVEEMLDEQGFVGGVETDEGAFTLLPMNTYYGEFDDDVMASSLVDAIDEAFAAKDIEISSMLITEMGKDQVLIGEEVEEEEEGEEEGEEEAGESTKE